MKKIILGCLVGLVLYLLLRASTPNGKSSFLVNSFVADPAVAKRGQLVTLSWNTQGADRVQILSVRRSYSDDFPIAEHDWPPIGTTQISLTEDDIYWVGFTIGPVNLHGDSYQPWIKVQILCPYTYFFAKWATQWENVSEHSCPLDKPHTNVGFYQAFEHGMMLMQNGTHEVYALFDHPGRTYPGYWPFTIPDNFNAISIAEIPPLGRYMPLPEFKTVWFGINRGVGDLDVRGILGWPIDKGEQYTFNTQIIADSGRRGLDTPVYSLPDGRVINLNSLSRSWTYIIQLPGFPSF